MIRTIVAATDGSDHAGKAVAIAGELAGKCGAELVLLHGLLRDANSATLHQVANRRALNKEQRDLLDNYELDAQTMMISAGDVDGYVRVPPPRELLEPIARQVLDRAEAVAKKAGAKKIRKRIIGSDPAEAILEEAKREKADLIVLGTRGLGELKGFFLGSVSHKVSARAECPCLTVK
jgi:nucleotide-binding universal stress UspA family protein